MLERNEPVRRLLSSLNTFAMCKPNSRYVNKHIQTCASLGALLFWYHYYKEDRSVPKRWCGTRAKLFVAIGLWIALDLEVTSSSIIGPV